MVQIQIVTHGTQLKVIIDVNILKTRNIFMIWNTYISILDQIVDQNCDKVVILDKIKSLSTLVSHTGQFSTVNI